MHLKSTPILATALSVLLLASLPGVPADHDDNLTTEWHSYVGNDLVLGVAFPPCDDSGIGGVAFCQALENETLDGRPHRVHIDIREDAGPRVAGYYMFVRGDGSSIPGSQGGQGYFCGSINHYVPLEARELVVFVTPVDMFAFEDFLFDTTFWAIDKAFDVIFDEDEAGELDTSGAACGSAGTLGTVLVDWRYNAPVPCFHTPC